MRRVIYLVVVKRESYRHTQPCFKLGDRLKQHRIESVQWHCVSVQLLPVLGFTEALPRWLDWLNILNTQFQLATIRA